MPIILETKMKILIIENLSYKKVRYRFFEKTLLTMFSILPTLYTRRIAAITPKKYSVSVVNERYEKINLNQHYDLVNIHFTTSTTEIAYELADKFRKKNFDQFVKRVVKEYYQGYVASLFSTYFPFVDEVLLLDSLDKQLPKLLEKWDYDLPIRMPIRHTNTSILRDRMVSIRTLSALMNAERGINNYIREKIKCQQ